MDDNDSGWPPDRRPWFGPKRFGTGYGLRTWQGVLVTVVLVLLVAGTAAATGGHSPLIRDLPAPRLTASRHTGGDATPHWGWLLAVQTPAGPAATMGAHRGPPSAGPGQAGGCSRRPARPPASGAGSARTFFPHLGPPPSCAAGPAHQHLALPGPIV